MPNLTTVTLTNGAGSGGTGTVSTLDNVIGTAGAPSAQVQTVQGITSMTPLKVDGSGVTQPVSGSVSLTGATNNINNISGTVSLPTGAATAAKQPALGTAGTASTDVLTVQGIASMTALKVDGSAVTQPVSGTVTANIGTGITKGAGASDGTTTRVTIDSSQIGTLGSAASSSSVPVVPATDWVGTTALSKFGTGYYVAVAASQTASVLQSSTGATGDYISGVLVIPATTSPGNVLLLDNATSMTVFTGGASSVTNLVPFFIPLGAVSRSGAWKLTTGANVSCIAIGKFS